jgi:hypothetical protein
MQVGKEKRKEKGRKVVSYGTGGTRKVKRRWLRITQQEKCEGELGTKEEIYKRMQEENIN